MNILFAADPLFYQRILRQGGFYAGPLDGLWGQASIAADLAFRTTTQALKTQYGGFDTRSETAIQTLVPAAQRAARRMLAAAATTLIGQRMVILSGTRSYAEQTALYAGGRTAPGMIVTKAAAGQSNHNFGIAWDIGLFDRATGRYLTGSVAGDAEAYFHAGRAAVALGGIEWGGNWPTFPDPPHYQIAGTDALKDLKVRFETGVRFVDDNGICR